jgi:hypothetical protein
MRPEGCGKPAPMANARETGGPPPVIFEIHRTLVVPSGDGDPDGVDCATKRWVFISFRAAAAE